MGSLRAIYNEWSTDVPTTELRMLSYPEKTVIQQKFIITQYIDGNPISTISEWRPIPVILVNNEGKEITT